MKMWEWERIVSLFLTSFAVAMMPGPNNLILASAGSLMGFTRGLRVLLAVMIGFPVMAFVVSLGLGKLIEELEWLFWALRVVGVSLLFWIAWKIGSASLDERGDERRGYGFGEILLFQWVNPKAWVMTTGFSSVYLTSGGSVWKDAGMLGGMFFLATLVTGSCWLWMGSLIGVWLRHKLWGRVYSVSMALLLLLSVLSVMWGEL